jgi:hypothetical protein
MGDPTGEVDKGALRLDFDRRLLLQFRGSAITSDAGLLPYRELDDTLGLTDTGANTVADARTGKNGRHRLAGLLRQSVFGRLAGYEDVNDADRLCRDPAMRWVVGDRAVRRNPLVDRPVAGTTRARMSGGGIGSDRPLWERCVSMQAKRSVPAPRRSQLAELDSCCARGNRFTIAQHARSRDPGPTTHPDRGNVGSISILLSAVVPVGMWVKVSISSLSELAREAGEAQPVGIADRPHIHRPSR